MSDTPFRKPLAIALGAAFVGSLSGLTVANAADNPFAMTPLAGSYRVADASEGRCGANMNMDGGMPMHEGRCGMMSMDTNKDGKISKEEFMAGHEAMFSKADTNGDGVIDTDEMKAMHKACAANMKNSP